MENKPRRFRFLKNFTFWFVAFTITIVAALYQRTTGPTYPKKVNISLNDSMYNLKLVRSIDLSEPSVVKLKIIDTTIKANLWYRRFKTDDKFILVPFKYKATPIESFLMNKVFHIYNEKGLFAEVPQQPPAGKLEYYVEISDTKGTVNIMKENPAVIRFKGSVPSYILVPHIIMMFIAMLFSTAAGLMSVFKYPSFKKYAIWTLVLLTLGGMILGPLVQKFAFGELWTGIPFGWDLTDNKTLIAWMFWVLAVIMNRKHERPLYTALAALVLLLVYSIPHSMFGSELDYSSGQVTQGVVLAFFIRFKIKNLF